VVQEEDSKRRRLGPKVAFWAGRYLEGPTSLAPVWGFVGRLSREKQLGDAAVSYLTILDHDELVCAAVERSEHEAQFFVQLGAAFPFCLSDRGAGRPVGLDRREVAGHRRRGFGHCGSREFGED
jgi:DNA-binding IclR family transcriptional regulator